MDLQMGSVRGIGDLVEAPVFIIGRVVVAGGERCLRSPGLAIYEG